LFNFLYYIHVRLALGIAGGLGRESAYKFGRFVTWLLRDILKYRKKTISDNLNASFIGFNEVELYRVVNAYYKRLGELVAENARIPFMSIQSMRQSSTFTNPEILDKYYEKGQSVMVIMGHIGNWEWAGLSAATRNKHIICAAYKPLKNIYFDNYLKRLRSRFGMLPIPISSIPRHVMSEKQNSPVCYTFIADQSPPPEQAEWLRFLHRDTPFFTGWAKLAQKTNLPVLYAGSRKIKRGNYQVTFHEISIEPAKDELHYLVSQYAKFLEKDILTDIPSWLWSHKRWKHSPPLT
jgi:Kdo2-lipid IVA lauroyltransferase/acyltransferase